MILSTDETSSAVSRAVKGGRLRKLGYRLYSKNLIDPPETVVRRNLWQIAGPMEGDQPFIAGLHLASPARAYLENMRPARARKSVARRLPRIELEHRLDDDLRARGDTFVNVLRDQARHLSTRSSELCSGPGRRRSGAPRPRPVPPGIRSTRIASSSSNSAFVATSLG